MKRSDYRRGDRERLHRALKGICLYLSVALPGMLFPSCSDPVTPFSGNFVQRDFPGSRMTIRGSEVVQTEGEGIKPEADVFRKTGTVYFASGEKGKEEFKVKWDVSDPNAIQKSRFLAEYEGDTFVGLRELIEGGVGTAVINVVFVPETDATGPEEARDRGARTTRIPSD